MPQFQPLNLGSVYQQAEALRAMRSNEMTNQLQREYMRDVQLPNARAAESRAVAQESRAAQTHASEQTLTALRTLNAAAAEIAANPQAATRWMPQLKAAGIPVEQLGPLDQNTAKQLFDSTTQALQAYNAGSGAIQAKPSALVEQYALYQAQGGKLPFVDPNGRGQDFVTQFSRSQVGAQFGAPTDVPGVGVVMPSRTQGPAANVVLSPETDVAAAEADRAGRAATARAQSEATAEQQKELTANQRTLGVWNVAKGGLERALSGTRTGPEQAMLPAVTAGQQIADGAVAAVAPVLKQLFRSAGEGVFTDRDQQLLLDMVPTREDHAETRIAKIQMIDAIIQAKLAASIPGDGPGQPNGQPAPQGVEPSLWEHMTPEERALWQ